MSTSNDKPKQRGRRWLATATPIEVDDALHSGALDDLLSGRPVTDQPDDKPEQITRDQLATMTPEQIIAAQKAGQLEDVITGAVDSE